MGTNRSKEGKTQMWEYKVGNNGNIANVVRLWNV